MRVTEIIQFQPGEPLALPIFSTSVQAGFPSPADDQIDSRQDLNTLLVTHPLATYFVKVNGDSMTGSGIHSGDILIVDRSLEPTEGKVVIACLDGELTVKKLKRIRGKLYLVAENPDYKPILVSEGSELQIWGVVTYSIHKP